MSDREALAMVRVALKGARGLALDAGEDVLDQEFANAIEAIDRLAEAALPVPDLDGLRTRLREAIGESEAGVGLPHWHHASGGTTDKATENDRAGVFVDRQAVLDAIDAVLR